MDARTPPTVGLVVTGASLPLTDPFKHADKQRSWDDFGSEYWAAAATTSHPSRVETAAFLSGAGLGCRLLVLGATTTEVTRTAMASGAEVHVMDFAGKLLELTHQTFGDAVVRHYHDLLNPPPSHLAGRFDLVVADRLVNRFHRSEMPGVVANMVTLVAPAGELRISLRFGLYPIDRRLIELGREHGTLENFWDTDTRTIDWSGVGTELDKCAEEHGSIPRDVVIAWSRMRGVESRLETEDVPAILAEASAKVGVLRIRDMIDMDVAPQSKIYIVVRDLPRPRGD